MVSLGQSDTWPVSPYSFQQDCCGSFRAAKLSDTWPVSPVFSKQKAGVVCSGQDTPWQEGPESFTVSYRLVWFVQGSKAE